MRTRKAGLPPTAFNPPPRSVMKPPPMHMKAPPAGSPPHPRRPRLVRDAEHGLGDLFALFPELPWPPRPRIRAPISTLARRLRRV